MLRNYIVLPEIFLDSSANMDGYWHGVDRLLDHIVDSHNMVLDVFDGKWREMVFDHFDSSISMPQFLRKDIKEKLIRISDQHLVSGIRRSDAPLNSDEFRIAMDWRPREAVAIVLGQRSIPGAAPRYRQFMDFLSNKNLRQEMGGDITILERTGASIIAALVGVLSVSRKVLIIDRYIYENLAVNESFISDLVDLIGSAYDDSKNASLKIEVYHYTNFKKDSKHSTEEEWKRNLAPCGSASGVFYAHLWSHLTHERFLFADQYRVWAPSGFCPVEKTRAADREFGGFTWASPKMHSLALQRNPRQQDKGYRDFVRIALPVRGAR